MDVDELPRRIDAVSAQIIAVRDRPRGIDPHDRGGPAASVARLHDLLELGRGSVFQVTLPYASAARDG